MQPPYDVISNDQTLFVVFTRVYVLQELFSPASSLEFDGIARSRPNVVCVWLVGDTHRYDVARRILKAGHAGRACVRTIPWPGHWPELFARVGRDEGVHEFLVHGFRHILGFYAGTLKT